MNLHDSNTIIVCYVAPVLSMPYKVRDCMIGTDSLLLLLGLKVFVSSNLLKLINILLRIVWIFNIYWVLWVTIGGDKQTLLFYCFNVYTVSVIIFQHHFILSKLNVIRRLFIQILCNLDNNSRKIIRRFSIGVALSHIIIFSSTNYLISRSETLNQTISEKVFGRFNFNMSEPESQVTVILIDFTLNYLRFLEDWQLYGQSLYIFFLICTHQLNVKHFTSIRSFIKLNMVSDLDFIRITMKSKNLLNNTKVQFDKIFNMLPILWFCSYFFWSTVFIMSFKRNGSQYLSLYISYAIYAALTTSIIFSIIFYIQHIDNYIKDEKRHCIQLLQANGKVSSLNQELINIIADTEELHLTGWQCFDLNRGLILTFAQSLVTLSVLFVQLLNSGL